jgi:hypothetical protein
MSSVMSLADPKAEFRRKSFMFKEYG